MARFKIKRQRPYNAADRYPWKMKDATRPHYLGQFPTLELAIESIDRTMRRELGLPEKLELDPAEILAAMGAKS
ncbi:hypothetical protein QEH40_gp46 [Microbacterium phage OscarSo]|uniref:Uncharacterized protein n=1 Tax=Microbacterium phage OscarSo TaxID=2985324 RepID=A0A9X9K364_9CAUD|nr:hypothetical protein QEH40_gp46 [Microbacterium phage OscarSo]UYL87167.1 hypothetical protein SEA_OSCARSO_46 [Microbacterium phage OscarSo]